VADGPRLLTSLAAGTAVMSVPSLISAATIFRRRTARSANPMTGVQFENAVICCFSSAVEQRFCNSFFLGRSPLFLYRKTSDFSGFYLLSTIGGTGRPGGTKRYYQAQKQAQLITVCSRLALVEFDFCKRYRMRALGPISAFATEALKT
jgi:hypothetical protein